MLKFIEQMPKNSAYSALLFMISCRRWMTVFNQDEYFSSERVVQCMKLIIVSTDNSRH